MCEAGEDAHRGGTRLRRARDGGLINGHVPRSCRCFSASGVTENVVRMLLFSPARRLFPASPPHPSIPRPPPIKTAGCSEAGSSSPPCVCASYRIHGGRRTHTNTAPVSDHAIVASEGWRLRDSPRSSPVSILPLPLPLLLEQPGASHQAGSARDIRHGLSQ